MRIGQHSKIRFALALCLVMLNAPVQADPATVAKNSRAWRANHEREILAEFAELLSIPNLANDTPNIRRNAEAIRTMCEKRGLICQTPYNRRRAACCSRGSRTAKCETNDCILRPLRWTAGRCLPVEKRTMEAGHA
jgi:hypothetical protein